MKQLIQTISLCRKEINMTVLTESALTGNIPTAVYIIAAAIAAVVIIAAVVMGVISKKKNK